MAGFKLVRVSRRSGGAITESKGHVSLASLAEERVTVPLIIITYLLCEP